MDLRASQAERSQNMQIAVIKATDLDCDNERAARELLQEKAVVISQNSKQRYRLFRLEHSLVVEI